MTNLQIDSSGTQLPSNDYYQYDTKTNYITIGNDTQKTFDLQAYRYHHQSLSRTQAIGLFNEFYFKIIN